MDEVFFTCLGLGFGLFLLATAIAGWVALARAHRLEKELRTLRTEVRALERENKPQSSTAAPGPAPAAKVAPLQSSAEMAAELARERVPAASPVAPYVPAPAPPRSPPAPSSPPPPRREPPQPARERVKIDWERWLGVRGFAVVGGVLFALAAILLFQHAFTHNWIPPWARVALGIGAGLAAIAWAARLRRKEFGWAPSALEGAGVVALYASLWAAQQRYALVGPGIAFPGMALVTALAGWLALKHGSLFSALLGLSGGFATPLLLAQGHERPVPLFGYVLLLDLGLLFVARKRSWTVLGLLALACTQVLLGAWIFARGGAAWPGLGFALAFAAVFALVRVQAPRAARGLALVTQALGLLAPFLFALHYASALGLGRHFGWTAAYLALLTVLATVVARRPDAGWLAGAAAMASAAVAITWFVGLTRVERGAADDELVLFAAGLAVLAHAFAEWERRRAARSSARQAAAVASVAWMATLFLTEALPAEPSFGFWSFLGGVTFSALLLVRQAVLLARAELVLLPGFSLGFALARLAHRSEFSGAEDWPDARLLFALPALGAALLLFVLPRLARSLERRAAQAAAALVVVFTLVTHVAGAPTLFEPHAWLAGVVAFVLGALVWVAATRGPASVLAVLAVLCALSFVTRACSWPLWTEQGAWESHVLATWLSVWLGAAGLTLFAPFFVARVGRARAAWGALALSGVLQVFDLAALQFTLRQRDLLGLDFDALPFLALAVPQLLAASVLLRRAVDGTARAWLGSCGLALLAFAAAVTLGRDEQAWTSPLVLHAGAWIERGELAVGAALAALGLAALARRSGLAAPRWVATGLALLALLPLLVQLFAQGVYPRQGPLAPWIAYEHLVPAAALTGALACLPPTDGGLLQRARRAVLGTCVLLLVFLWLNWTIENAFTETERVTLFAAKGHARDLTTSLVWGVYGMVLLLLGTWRRVTSLRWASLAVLLLSIGKVFLHDLAHLDGLYRVASLAGLALSLIGVSLFYQRFVFGKVGARASANPPANQP